MSRNEAKRRFKADDMVSQTAGVECRKDRGVVDEIPGAYKNIDTVMANQSDLVDIVHTLKQVVCVPSDAADQSMSYAANTHLAFNHRRGDAIVAAEKTEIQQPIVISEPSGSLPQQAGIERQQFKTALTRLFSCLNPFATSVYGRDNGTLALGRGGDTILQRGNEVRRQLRVIARQVRHPRRRLTERSLVHVRRKDVI